jgi:zinc protease
VRLAKRSPRNCNDSSRRATETEVAEAKSGLLKRRQLSRTQDSTLAAALVHQAYLGRTFDTSAKIDAAIAALTVSDVNAALRKYVQPDAFAFRIRGNVCQGTVTTFADTRRRCCSKRGESNDKASPGNSLHKRHVRHHAVRHRRIRVRASEIKGAAILVSSLRQSRGQGRRACSTPARWRRPTKHLAPRKCRTSNKAMPRPRTREMMNGMAEDDVAHRRKIRGDDQV